MAALTLLPLLLLPDLADAHQRLVRADPPRDATLTAVPQELRLVFAEPVQLTFTRLELTGPAGAVVPMGELRVHPDSANILIAPITGALQAGSYTVHWATASRDGHPVRGDFGFSIAPDAVGLAPEPDTLAAPPPALAPAPELALAEPAPFTAESPAYVAVRWVTYLALIGIIGAAAFALLVLWRVRRRGTPEGAELLEPARRRAAGVGLAITALLAVAGLARLYAQSLAMHGAEGVLDTSLLAPMLTQTIWGTGWLLQIAATVLAATGFVLARRGSGGGWALAAVAALALAVTPALSGHAAAMTGTWGTLAVLADWLHVLAAGGWLGSLFVLLIAGMPPAMRLGAGRRGAGVAALVNAFSPTALMFAGLLVLTGLFATVVHSGSLSALVASDYGTLLFLKLGIFLLVFATGAYNYLRVRPALGRDLSAQRLQRSAGFELAVGAVVLLVTAMLVATARPFEDHHRDAAEETTAEIIRVSAGETPCRAPRLCSRLPELFAS